MARKMTCQELVIKMLEADGCREVTANGRKHRKFETAERGRDFFFVGKCGGLRLGRNVSDSFGLSVNFDKLRARFEGGAK